MTRLSSQLRERADDARLERIWRVLDERFDRRKRQLRLRRAGLGLVALCAAALLLFVRGQSSESPPVHSPAIIELADGSRIEHTVDDQLEVEGVSAERVEVRLTRGGANFSVAPNPAREFLTHAAGYTVRVLGTQYRVALDGSQLLVRVWRGVVEVRDDQRGNVWRVRAGETWTSSATDAAPPIRDGSMPAAAAPIAASAPVMARRGRHAPTNQELPDAAPTTEDGAALFERAQQARLAGRPEEAVEALVELLRRFPRDHRAGVSAFELARLRLDLGDARGALEALDRARSAGYALAEQVEMRRVQALEAMGDLLACRAARDAFLERYPRGTFRSVVSRRCP